jgi:uncharacterized protein YoxC
VTDWQVVWIAVAALAVAVMAIAQVAVVVAAYRIAKQASRAIEELRRDVRPLIEKATLISDNAAKASALAVTQAERIDRLLETTAGRIDETVGLVQDAIIEPVRQSAAVVAGLRAAFTAFRGWRERPTRDEEEALFVG